MSLATNTQNNTRPKFLFQLISEIGTVNCSLSPKGFNGATIELNRDMDFAGVFIDFKVSELTFIGSPEKRLLRDLWNQKGLMASCSLRVSYLDRTTQDYVAFSSDFILDFSEYNEVKVSKSRNGVRIKAESTGFVKKIKDRKKTKVDLSRTTSLGGYDIILKDHWADLSPVIRNTMLIPQVDQSLVGSFYEQSLPSNVTIPDNVIPQLTVLSSDFNELVSQSQTLLSGGSVDPTATNAIFLNSESERDVLLNGGITVDLTTSKTIELELRYAIINLDGVTIDDDSLIASESGFISGVVFSMTDFAITIPSTKSLVIYVKVATSSESITAKVYSVNNFNIKQVEVGAPSKYIETYPIYEALERNLQLILDTQYPLYSEFFGRTDVVYNNDGDMYLTENQERFANLFNGLSVRGLSFADINNSIAVNIDDIYDSYNSRWNIGLGPEQIDGQEKVRVEERAFFFVDSVGVDLSSRINDIEIEYEALPDLAYSQIESGYKEFDYELINGRGEYNTKNERTSILPIDSKFDNVSPYRGDTMGLTKLLNDPITPDDLNDASGTKDLEGDSDIYIFKSYDRGAVVPYSWDIEQQENIQIVDDTSLFGDTSFNLFFTPTRMLLRHNYELASGLDKETNSYLRFQTSDKLQNLKTTDGVDEITENQDILVDDLGNPKWFPAQYIISLPFYEADIIDLIDNKYKLIKLSDTKQGWLLKASYKIISNEIELTILQKYE